MARASSSPIAQIIVVDAIPPSGLEVAVEPDAAQRAALAKLNGLVSLPAMRASLLIRPEARGGIHVSGTVTAHVVQTCVVTLDPVEASLCEPVDIHFLPEAPLEALRSARVKRLAAGAEPEVIEDDEPDLIVDGRIDIGAVAAEHLTLGLDPYPRKPGAGFAEPGSGAADERVSPFAALKDLKGGVA